MTNEAFQTILEGRIDAMRKTLASKAKEYAAPTDRLHNFKRAAGLLEGHPAEALQGMLVKHWVSIEDLVRLHTVRGGWTDPAVANEKLGDAVNYLVLLEALLTENHRG